MQIESLTQERLEELRKLWMGTTDPNRKAEITAEGQATKAYLLNPKWGSKEVGGNSFCYTCHVKEARVGHYNCLGCAGEVEVNYQARSLQGMQQALSEWSKHKPMERKLSTLETAIDIFGNTIEDD
jgi:hypothetical protein